MSGKTKAQRLYEIMDEYKELMIESGDPKPVFYLGGKGEDILVEDFRDAESRGLLTTVKGEERNTTEFPSNIHEIATIRGMTVARVI